MLSDFGLTGADGEPTIEELIRWVRGEDVEDEDLDPATTVIKQMGDRDFQVREDVIVARPGGGEPLTHGYQDLIVIE